MKRSVTIFVVGLALAIVMPYQAAGAEDQAPNPVAVSAVTLSGHKTYQVTCSQGDGSLGTWVQITNSVLTTQPSLIYSNGLRYIRQSILYCTGSGGQVGIMKNAPAALLLPAGTRVNIVPSINIVYSGHGSAGFEDSWPLDSSGALQIDDNRVTFMPDLHSLYVYPIGASVSAVSGGMATYIRPGSHPRLLLPQVAGCTVRYVAQDGKIETTRKFPQNDCEQLVSKGSF